MKLSVGLVCTTLLFSMACNKAAKTTADTQKGSAEVQKKADIIKPDSPTAMMPKDDKPVTSMPPIDTSMGTPNAIVDAASPCLPLPTINKALCEDESIRLEQKEIDESKGQIFYTGFDPEGKTDYSVLIPHSMVPNNLQAGATSGGAYDVGYANGTLSTAEVDALITEKKTSLGARFTPAIEQSCRTDFAKENRMWSFKPIGQNNQTKWQVFLYDSAPHTCTQVVTFKFNNYSDSTLQAGKARYNNAAGKGTAVACVSCHGSGASGAPAHQLGNVMKMSDADLVTWITTGKLGTRTAKVAHSWTFANDNEKTGIVAYLRSLAAKDPKALTKYYIDPEARTTASQGK